MTFTIDHTHDPAQDLHLYHVAGLQDAEHHAFWDWLNEKNRIRYSYEEFLRGSGFIFRNEAGRQEFLARWSESLGQSETRPIDLKNLYDQDREVDPNDPEEMLAQILREEIDREVLAQMGHGTESGKESK